MRLQHRHSQVALYSQFHKPAVNAALQDTLQVGIQART